jgi:hypothetical protein
MTIGRLGRLPDPIPDRPVLMLPSRAEIALPVPPPAVDNNGLIKRYNNLGNLKYGDCVIAAIGHDCEVAYVASGLKDPGITSSATLDLYKRVNPDFDPSDPGGPGDRGCVSQVALDALMRYGISGRKPLCFAKVPTDLTAIRDAMDEFRAVYFGVQLDTAQQRQPAVWNYEPSPVWGGHGVSGGSYTTVLPVNPHSPGLGPDRTGIITWGKRVNMSDSFIAHQVEEVFVIVWAEIWPTLTPTRQEQLRADYTALTGKQIAA